MAESPPSALSLMVHTMAVAEFVDRHWGRRAGYFRGPRERLGLIYDLGHWRRFQHVGAVDAAVRDATGRQRQIAADPDQVSTLLAAGMTICADVSAQPQLSAFLRMLVGELRIGGHEAPFAKLYVSPEGGGFAMHMDAHHVFVLQLEGDKTWRYGQEPAVPWTLENGKLDEHGRPVAAGPRDGVLLVDDRGRPLAAPREASLCEVTLTPGDCLYLPPGTWHTTKARGSSIALSVSPPRAPVARLLLDVLEQQLLGSADWRRDLLGLPADVTDPASVPSPIRDAITRRLRELGRTSLAMDARHLQRTWCAEVSRAAAPRADDSPPVVEPLERDHRLAHAPGGFLHVVAPSEEMGDEAVFIYRRGVEWVFPGQAQEFVRELGRNPTFVAADVLAWDPRLDWDGAHEVLGQLLAAGIVIRSS